MKTPKHEFKINQIAIHMATKAEVRAGKIVHAEDRREVRVMAFGGNYAMIRRTDPRGAMPYCVMVRDLRQPTPSESGD